MFRTLAEKVQVGMLRFDPPPGHGSSGTISSAQITGNVGCVARMVGGDPLLNPPAGAGAAGTSDAATGTALAALLLASFA